MVDVPFLILCFVGLFEKGCSTNWVYMCPHLAFCVVSFAIWAREARYQMTKQTAIVIDAG